MNTPRRRPVKRMNTVMLTLMVIGFVILLPLWVPLACVAHGVYLRRLHSAANRAKCVACGQILGKESVERADAEWAEHIRELRERHPGVKFRLVRSIHAICTLCGTRYRYDEKTRELAALEARDRSWPLAQFPAG